MDQAMQAGAQLGGTLGHLIVSALTGNRALKDRVYQQTQQAMADQAFKVEQANKAGVEARLGQDQLDNRPQLGSAIHQLFPGVSTDQSGALETLARGSKEINLADLMAAALRTGAVNRSDAGNTQGANGMLAALSGKPLDYQKVSDGVAFNPNVTPAAGAPVATPVGMADIAAKMANAFQSKAAAANSYAQAEKARSEIGSGSPVGGGKPADWSIQQGADGQLYRVNKLTGAAIPVVTQGNKTEGTPVLGANRFRYQAQSQKIGKARSAVNAADFELDRLAKAAQDVLDSGGLGGITGIEGKFPNMPGSKASNTQALLDTLKSQVGFSVLQNMRANSPTGGALGSVSDRENEMLQSNLAALGQAQSEEQYRQQLQNIIDYARQSKQRRHAAFDETYGTDGGDAAQGGSTGPKPGEVDGGYRFKGGDPSDPNSWEKL